MLNLNMIIALDFLKIRNFISTPLLCLSFVGITASQPNHLKASEPVYSQTHLQVPLPHDLQPGNEVLWVSLQKYLGRQELREAKSLELKIKSAGSPLILKDANDLIHKADQIRIEWRKIVLKKPKKISRKFAGPFASFESAQRFSLDLKKKGITSVIANPDLWEVWVSSTTQLPKSIKMKEFNQKLYFEIHPLLKLRNNEFLLTGPISIKAPEGIIWKGGIYQGPFYLQHDAYGSWTFIEQVPIERYLQGVVPHEIGPSSPLAALSAQTVLARTWALANSNRFKVDGYHLCSDTQCQVYKNPQIAGFKVKKAIKQTSNKILTWEGQPINAVYHATNGGVIASINEAWTINSLPYSFSKLDGSSDWTRKFKLPLSTNDSIKKFLLSKQGAYGKNHYLFRWERTVTDKQLQNQLIAFTKNTSIDLPKTIKVLERGRSGRVLALEIIGQRNGSSIVLKRDAIRKAIRNLPSTLFVVNQKAKGIWDFWGGGFGHGAGLSQAGAIDLAKQGWSTEQILKHYYPGTKYGILQF